MFVVLLHWLCMFLTLVIPNKLFKRDGESGGSGNVKWILKSLVLAYIYIFAYLNLESDKHQVRLRMALYYGVIFAENLLLVTLWSIETRTALHHSKSDRVRVFLSASLPFIAGKLTNGESPSWYYVMNFIPWVHNSSPICDEGQT